MGLGHQRQLQGRCRLLLATTPTSTPRRILLLVVVVLLSTTTTTAAAAAWQPFQPRRATCHTTPTTEHRYSFSRLEASIATTNDDSAATTTTTTAAQPAAASASSAASSSSAAAASSPWYPRRIQDALDYDAIVQRLYVRQIVTETKDVADWVWQTLQQPQQQTSSSSLSSQRDPFGQVARQISACTVTRDDAGRIGWIDRPLSTTTTTSLYDDMLPPDVVRQLYQRQPKAGDIVLLQSTASHQWHVLRVEELWITPPFETNNNNPSSSSSSSSSFTPVVGSHGGTNRHWNRRENTKKLPGHGVSLAQAPPLEEWRTYQLQTTGCQMNVADSERLEGILQHALHLQPHDPEKQQTNKSRKYPNLVIFNTCSIRDHAEQKLYDAVGPYAAQKRRGQNKELVIAITGCVAQQEGEALLRRVPEIDLVVGPQYIPFLGNLLDRVSRGYQVVATAPMLLQDSQHPDPNNNNKNNNNALSSVVLTDDNPEEHGSPSWDSPPIRGHSVRAFVNIIHGCNEHCTYCVVPATRGMEQSRTMEAILQECLDLVNQGYKEVTLLGQNIDAYGRDMVPKRSFAELLEFLNDRIPTQKMRLRYVTSHPRYFSDRVIDAVAHLDKVCECFHVPFQAGDDQVLKAMRRGYTYASYMRIIDKIRAQAPDSSICGDVIVGFPGETDEAFEKTLALMRQVKFDNLNTFAYSPRPNTEAALWENQIPEEVKSERLQRVQALAKEHGLERSLRYVGRVEEILVEDRNPKNPRQVMGRTRQGRQVYFDGDLESLQGEFVNVRITEARTWSLMGEMVED